MLWKPLTMESRGFRMLMLLQYIAILVATYSMLCDGRSSLNMLKFQGPRVHLISTHSSFMKKVTVANDIKLDINMPQLDSPNTQAYGPNSPFSLPPYVSISPENSPSPPSCLLPPQNSPQTPPTPINSPPNPPKYAHGLPPPSPPMFGPSPPKHGPSPSKPTPTQSPPPGFEPPPPVAYPPPNAPPSPHKGSSYAVWCVAKPTVPDPIMQEAMDYACGAGANCKPIQPSGLCYQPNTLLSHASFAFNSYWQKKKLSGGTCDFGGTAMLVTVDPSFDKCRFDLN